uniref:Putative secreted protein n=1 Tax=Ixodes ricinus TaxID=34613 RepID=A0A147BDV6_IXORI
MTLPKGVFGISALAHLQLCCLYLYQSYARTPSLFLKRAEKDIATGASAGEHTWQACDCMHSPRATCAWRPKNPLVTSRLVKDFKCFLALLHLRGKRT